LELVKIFAPQANDDQVLLVLVDANRSPVSIVSSPEEREVNERALRFGGIST
jgi:hypothetical protein